MIDLALTSRPRASRKHWLRKAVSACTTLAEACACRPSGWVTCRSRSSIGSLQFAVVGQHVLAAGIAEMLREFFGKIHRTVPSAGAAEGDRDVAARFGFEAR